MSFDWQQHIDELVAHYAELARDPGWVDYARARVKQLQAEKHGFYADLGQRVGAAVRAAATTTTP